jgi:hypothetical protein
MKRSARAALAAGALAIAMGAGFLAGQVQAGQPHMRNALGNLRAARSELQMAERNKGGHRVAAINYVDRAISEVEAGMDVADDY